MKSIREVELKLKGRSIRQAEISVRCTQLHEESCCFKKFILRRGRKHHRNGATSWTFWSENLKTYWRANLPSEIVKFRYLLYTVDDCNGMKKMYVHFYSQKKGTIIYVYLISLGQIYNFSFPSSEEKIMKLLHPYYINNPGKISELERNNMEKCMRQ